MRCPYGPRTGISNAFHILRGLYGPCKGAVRHPYGRVRELKQPEFAKIPHGRMWSYGQFTDCLRFLNPYGARKLIMHALKLYGPHKGRQISYGAARAPWVDARFLFKTAREQPVRGAGVWCDWGIRVGSRTGCLRYLNPYGVRKRIMHAFKTQRDPYGEAKFVRCRTGPGDRRKIFVKTAREQPVVFSWKLAGAGVRWAAGAGVKILIMGGVVPEKTKKNRGKKGSG